MICVSFVVSLWEDLSKMLRIHWITQIELSWRFWVSWSCFGKFLCEYLWLFGDWNLILRMSYESGSGRVDLVVVIFLVEGYMMKILLKNILRSRIIAKSPKKCQNNKLKFKKNTIIWIWILKANDYEWKLDFKLQFPLNSNILVLKGTYNTILRDQDPHN